jgi:hypothetical protein
MPRSTVEALRSASARVEDELEDELEVFAAARSLELSPATKS